jgi:hypothetical protein
MADMPTIDEVKDIFQKDEIYVAGTPIIVYSITGMVTTEKDLEEIIKWIQGKSTDKKDVELPCGCKVTDWKITGLSSGGISSGNSGTISVTS